MSDVAEERKDGVEAIRHKIGEAARKLVGGDILGQSARRFVKEFTVLENTPKRNLLPKAIRAGMIAAFEGTDLTVWPEARFTVPGTNDPATDVPKSMDFVITSKDGTPECRAVAIEVKATMEFNSLAAALIEIAMMTERPEVVVTHRHKKLFSIPTANLRCFTLSCNDNQYIEPLLHVMSRQLWPDDRRRVTHHRLFLESKKAGTPRLTASLGVHEFLDDITKWCLQP